jgi:hypothetical protein
MGGKVLSAGPPGNWFVRVAHAEDVGGWAAAGS